MSSQLFVVVIRKDRGRAIPFASKPPKRFIRAFYARGAERSKSTERLTQGEDNAAAAWA